MSTTILKALVPLVFVKDQSSHLVHLSQHYVGMDTLSERTGVLCMK